MFVASTLVGALLVQVALANVYHRQASAYNGYGNSTITAPPTGYPSSVPLASAGLASLRNGSQAQSNCCFLLQDTLSADYWIHYYTSTWYGNRRITSIVASVTQYVDTTITNYDTITTIKNSSYVTSFQVGEDNVGAYNNANKPFSTASMINATATSIYGTVVTSPAGFFVIPSVKIINVPAVTQANGQLACTTTSSWSLLCPVYKSGVSLSSTVASSAVFTGMNEGFQNYYSGQQGPPVLTEDGMKETVSRAAVNASAYLSTTVISFSTPYLYFPPNAATELEGMPDLQIDPVSVPGAVTTSSADITTTETIDVTSIEYIYVTESGTLPVPSSTTTPTGPPIDTDNRDYGYVPSDIIQWILKNPDYATQYPSLASCLPGGPSIIPIEGCVSAAADSAEVVPDLTTAGAVTVKAEGCFHPGNCAAGEPAVATKAAPAASAAPEVKNTGAAKVPPAKSQTLAALGAPAGNNPAQPKASSPQANPFAGIAPRPGGSPAKPQNKPSPSSPPPKIGAPAPGEAPAKPQNAPSPSSPPPEIGAPAPGEAPAKPQNAPSPSSPPPEIGAPAPVESPAKPQNAPSPPSPSPNLGAIIAGAFTAHPAVNEGSQTISADTNSNFVIGSHTISAGTSSNFIIGSQTLAPGSSPVVAFGSTFSLAPSASAIVVNGVTSALSVTPSPAAPGPVLTINSQTLTPNIASAYVINGQTLAPGSSPIAIGGTTYSLAPSASAIVINGQTSSLPAPQPSAGSANAPILTIGSEHLTANSASAYVISGQTLAPGSSPVTVGGTTYSLAPSASALVVNGQTSSLSPPASQGAAPVFTIGSQTITATPASASALVIGSQTLLPGGPAITINNTPISLAPSGSVIVVGGTTETLAPGTAPVFTVGSTTVTGSAELEYLVGSQTLVPGGSAITVNGVTVSLAPSGTAVVVNGTTESFSAPSTTTNGSSFGGSTFTGAAPSIERWLVGEVCALGIGILGLLLS